ERILIADPGLKQVIELNRDNEVLWQYGGPESDLLAEPVSVQRTWRQSYLIADRGKGKVLEISEEGHLLREYGQNLGLRQPVYACLHLDQQLLIVDAAEHEIYLLDEAGAVNFRFNYQPPELPQAMRLGKLEWVTETLNGKVLLGDSQGLLAADPRQCQIDW